MLRIVSILALGLAACASSPASEGWTATTNATRVPYANNLEAWLVTCGRAMTAECYSRAAQICPGGYEIVRDAVSEIVVTCKR
jgi:hypothetical protein